MSDNTNEHEKMAFCFEYEQDAAGWEEHQTNQPPFSYIEPETRDIMKRITRLINFIDR